MKPRFLALLLLIMLISSHSFALDYEITSVIEVGEADFHPYLSPVIWSPDGTMLAFTKGGVIKISDTLGSVRDIIKLDMPIHRWDWVSDKQIAVHMRRFTGNGPETEEELSLINILANSKSSIHRFKMERNYREIPGKTTSSGPYKTAEGNKFYLHTTYNAKSGKKVIERRSFLDKKTKELENDHLLRWGDDGLYMVKLDGIDSTWLAKKPFSRMGYKQIISSDLNYVMDGGLLFRLEDSTIIAIDTLLGEFPQNTKVCGIVRFSFNPVSPEVLFTISCDDGHNYVVHRIATFSYETLKLTILDPLIGIANCDAPTFSPDGRKISFMADNKIYILLRRLK